MESVALHIQQQTTNTNTGHALYLKVYYETWNNIYEKPMKEKLFNCRSGPQEE